MPEWERYGLNDFLILNPSFRLKKLSKEELIIQGEREIKHQMDGFQLVADSVSLGIQFNKDYPKDIPMVFELEGKIPRIEDYHVNRSDNSCCLGSSLAILDKIYKSPEINSFFLKCIDPFLYSVLHKITFNEFPYGELAHGEPGLIQDYQDLFGIKGKENVILLLKALSKSKKDANKLPCPCGCGNRVGTCDFRLKLNEWRKKSNRKWFHEHLISHFSRL